MGLYEACRFRIFTGVFAYSLAVVCCRRTCRVLFSFRHAAFAKDAVSSVLAWRSHDGIGRFHLRWTGVALLPSVATGYSSGGGHDVAFLAAGS